MTTASILGTVTDETGALVPGVTVTVRNQRTGLTRVALTDSEGRYRAPNLPLGGYELKAELQGFRAVVRTGVELTVDRDAVINFELHVGEISEQLVVTGAAPLVETTKSSTSALINERDVTELPLNGRSFDQLATLSPGVTITKSAPRGFFYGRGAKFSVAGARPNQSGMLLDGTDVNDVRGFAGGSVAGNFLGVDAIREFRVETSSYSAEFGGVAGAVINVVTKSGTNELHGTGFGFHRNDNLDARNFFDPGAPPEFKRNQFGFTIGGPIVRNRTFFLGAFEALRERLGLTQVGRVPTVAARQGILPTETVQISPVVKPILDLYPLPNGRDFGNGTAELLGSAASPTREDYFMVRIDHQWSDSDSFFARYTFDNATVRTPDDIRVFETFDRGRNQYLTLEESKIISSRLVNRARFGFNRSFQSSEAAPLVSIASSLDLTPVFPFGRSGNLSAGSGTSTLGAPNPIIPRITPYNQFEWSDDINLNLGGHSVKAGAIVKRIQFNFKAWFDGSGTLQFNTLRDFLLGRPLVFRAVLPGSDAVRGYRQTLFGGFLQDDIRITPHFTLNLGVRYESVTGPTEVNGKLSNFPPGATTPVILGSGSFFETDKNTFAPRLGFAWDPLGDGKTSVRSGFGIFYEHALPWHWSVAGIRQFPFFFRAAISRPPFNSIKEPFNSLPPLSEALGRVPQGPDSVFITKTPYMLQYNLTLQREIAPNLGWTVSYVGSRGINLFHGVERNTVIPDILPDGRKFFPPGRPVRNRALQRHIVTESEANSWYNSFQTWVEKRMSQGLQFRVAYTFGKSLDTHSSTFSGEYRGGSARTPLDPENQFLDKSVSNFHVQHNLTFNYVYELPFGPGRAMGRSLAGPAAKLLGGWQVNGILTLASGAPVHVQNRHDHSRHLAGGRDGAGDRPDLVAGRSNSPVLGGPDRYFDVSAFRLQPAGFFGTVGRNTVRGPGYANFDLSVVKNTLIPSISETFNVQFKAEFFNLPNRTNFGPPASTVFEDASGRPVGGVGRISDTVSTSRQLQFGIKFIW
ncbi:MAG: TonB-dependent receptor [Acidobacteria bacterium]|nr:TonB-dependent receptor [Acidobacteriota bacterium]